MCQAEWSCLGAAGLGPKRGACESWQIPAVSALGLGTPAGHGLIRQARAGSQVHMRASLGEGKTSPLAHACQAASQHGCWLRPGRS